MGLAARNAGATAEDMMSANECEKDYTTFLNVLSEIRISENNNEILGIFNIKYMFKFSRAKSSTFLDKHISKSQSG